ncbi:hypothetical protein [Aeoliella sp.]|uniref:hypothetical protein n=1 Tax=Aeoliella sp. TaxID=2795800 RepID=UPI003CCC466A
MILATTCLLGCAGDPEEFEMPSFSPDQAAKTAMAALDSNQDGQLSDAELAACPPLLSVKDAVDTDGNNSLSANEIKARVAEYAATNTGLQSLVCSATVRGRPLVGAVVKFIPVEFLTSAIGPAEATIRTNGSGVVLTGKLPGLAPGLYRVEVEAPSNSGRSIPAVYNSESKLWYEMNPSEPPHPAEFAVEMR